MSTQDIVRIDVTAAPTTSAAAPAEPSILALIKADLAEWAAVRGKRFPSLGAVLDALFMPGMMATVTFRLAHSIHRSGLRPFSRLLYIWNVVLFSCDIAPPAVIGGGLVMPHPVGVAIDGRCTIGKRVRVMGGVRLGGGNSEDPDKDGIPVVGDDCWLLDGCKAFGDVTIGESSVVAASAVLLQSIPPRSVAVGIPARVVRTRELG